MFIQFSKNITNSKDLKYYTACELFTNVTTAKHDKYFTEQWEWAMHLIKSLDVMVWTSILRWWLRNYKIIGQKNVKKARQTISDEAKFEKQEAKIQDLKKTKWTEIQELWSEKLINCNNQQKLAYIIFWKAKKAAIAAK